MHCLCLRTHRSDEGVATDTDSWDLLEDGAKPRQVLQRDVAVLLKPGKEGGERLKVGRFLFENSEEERLEKAWGHLEGFQVELLAGREEGEETAVRYNSTFYFFRLNTVTLRWRKAHRTCWTQRCKLGCA